MTSTDDYLNWLSAMIDEFGWAVTAGVPTDEDPPTASPFAYTVGLTAHGCPELADR